MANEEIKPLEDFDWASFEAGISAYDDKQTAELSKMYDETLTSIAENELIKGTVTAITKKEVVANIGYKSEAVVSINEFRYNPDLKVGDEVELYVEKQEDKNGQLVVSHKTAGSAPQTAPDFDQQQHQIFTSSSTSF